MAVVGGWLYMLAFGLHVWRDRILFGGMIICLPTCGLLFERWRQRGDPLAKVPFFLAAAAFAVAIIVGSISPREFVPAGVIAAVGAVAALSVRTARGRVRRR